MSGRGDGVLRGRAVLTDGVEMPISYGAYKGRGVDHFIMDGVRFEPVRTCSYTLEDDRDAKAGKSKAGEGEFVTSEIELAWTCSECGLQFQPTSRFPHWWLVYCPQCGAKVVGA